MSVGLSTRPAGGRQATAVGGARDRLAEWGWQRGWRGSDPYDGLDARRLRGVLGRSALSRRALTQAVKRSPIDLRGPLGIRPGRSAAALAHVVAAEALGPDGSRAHERLQTALDWLEDERATGFDEPCWGYHFDVQTRVFFYPRRSPNTIATAFAGLALLEAHERTGARRLLGEAERVGDFFLRHIPQTEAAPGAFFGYLPGDRTPIHNASMLVCALLARLAEQLDRPNFRAAAEAGVAYSVARQRPDGSWPYGEQPHLRWVDGFHTGYVLESLLACAEAGVGDVGEALARGLRFYRERLFGFDGAPRYTPGRAWPIDSQCVAQGIQTFALASRLDPAHRDWALRVFEFAQRRMRRADGLYLFQRRARWVNATPHVRWTVAPMLLAVTHLLRALEDEA